MNCFPRDLPHGKAEVVRAGQVQADRERGRAKCKVRMARDSAVVASPDSREPAVQVAPSSSQTPSKAGQSDFSTVCANTPVRQ